MMHGKGGLRIRRGLALGRLAGALLSPGAPAQAEEPVQYCARVGADDGLRGIPPALVPAARRVFHLSAPDTAVQRTTVYRCSGGAVLLCTTGANLPCGPADTSRSLPGASRYCSENPGSPFIPAFVTGHATAYRWRCAGSEAVAKGRSRRSTAGASPSGSGSPWTDMPGQREGDHSTPRRRRSRPRCPAGMVMQCPAAIIEEP